MISPLLAIVRTGKSGRHIREDRHEVGKTGDVEYLDVVIA
jgi:hypothetical protein